MQTLLLVLALTALVFAADQQACPTCSNCAAPASGADCENGVWVFKQSTTLTGTVSINCPVSVVGDLTTQSATLNYGSCGKIAVTGTFNAGSKTVVNVNFEGAEVKPDVTSFDLVTFAASSGFFSHIAVEQIIPTGLIELRYGFKDGKATIFFVTPGTLSPFRSSNNRPFVRPPQTTPPPPPTKPNPPPTTLSIIPPPPPPSVPSRPPTQTGAPVPFGPENFDMDGNRLRRCAQFTCTQPACADLAATGATCDATTGEWVLNGPLTFATPALNCPLRIKGDLQITESLSLGGCAKITVDGTATLLGTKGRFDWIAAKFDLDAFGTPKVGEKITWLSAGKIVGGLRSWSVENIWDVSGRTGLVNQICGNTYSILFHAKSATAPPSDCSRARAEGEAEEAVAYDATYSAEAQEGEVTAVTEDTGSFASADDTAALATSDESVAFASDPTQAALDDASSFANGDEASAIGVYTAQMQAEYEQALAQAATDSAMALDDSASMAVGETVSAATVDTASLAVDETLSAATLETSAATIDEGFAAATLDDTAALAVDDSAAAATMDESAAATMDDSAAAATMDDSAAAATMDESAAAATMDDSAAAATMDDSAAATMDDSAAATMDDSAAAATMDALAVDESAATMDDTSALAVDDSSAATMDDSAALAVDESAATMDNSAALDVDDLPSVAAESGANPFGTEGIPRINEDFYNNGNGMESQFNDKGKKTGDGETDSDSDSSDDYEFDFEAFQAVGVTPDTAPATPATAATTTPSSSSSLPANAPTWAIALIAMSCLVIVALVIVQVLLVVLNRRRGAKPAMV